METTLHQQLKQRYAATPADLEVRVGSFRIDAIRDGRLIEIQHAALGSIQEKIRRLLRQYEVTIVKPIVRRKFLIKQSQSEGPVVDQRWSPKQGSWVDLFHELVHFMRVFPHPKLSIELALIDIEEIRVPTDRRSRRRFSQPYRTLDQRLLTWLDSRTISTAHELLGTLGQLPPPPFHTGELAAALALPRWFATRIAYCLRESGVFRTVGKKGNAWLYESTPPARRRQRSGRR